MQRSASLLPGLRPELRKHAPLIVLALGWLVMFGPSYWGLANGLWASDAQGHGPIILSVGMWLLWRKRAAILALPRQPRGVLGAMLMALGVLLYALGRSQTIWSAEISAQLFVLSALLLCFFGGSALRLAWFPILFMVFMIPWPGEWVDAVTQPLKLAVSSVAADLLHLGGYPVGRSGVILTVGPYQLLVADACAGLNSLFTLEALGLLYMNLMGHLKLWRNVALALLIVPISFAANVVRVVTLVLVTYHFGDEAGQGFTHGFAGMVLFIAALVFILCTDHVLGLLGARFKRMPGAAA